MHVKIMIMQVVGALYDPREHPSYYSHLRFVGIRTTFWLLTVVSSLRKRYIFLTVTVIFVMAAGLVEGL